MERVTVSLDDDLLVQFDEYIHRTGYANRSEAVRDLIRAKLEADRLERDRAPNCVACVSYVYDHEERELSRRITQAHHAHHDLTHSTLHIHLDHDSCLEVAVLKGRTDAVRDFANALMAERGVRHGQLHLVPADLSVIPHSHGGHDHGHGHGHAPHAHHHPKT
ncbi:MAG TPA: nickel-responsive transcriptional regulator NikR [Azospirillum sp.]|nr:nickel-responsive transcriptional regulator NikR [Azospirillum sp.]